MSDFGISFTRDLNFSKRLRCSIQINNRVICLEKAANLVLDVAFLKPPFFLAVRYR